jgi:cytochrome c peroxidase
MLSGATAALSGAYVYNHYNNNGHKNNNNGKALSAAAALSAPFAASKVIHSKEDYQKIYNTIAERIRDDDEYDNAIGWGPVLVRYAWHSSGTYAQASSGCPASGGSFGGTIRHPREMGDGANNGLQNAEWFMQKVHKKHNWISWGDLVTLGGVVAIQELGGPKIGWRAGREDLPEQYAQNDRLPDASQGADYVRHLFARMGFSDREVVSLIGAHALGSCHVTAPLLPGQTKPIPGSGYTDRWTASPNFFTNEFFRLLIEDKTWHWKKWDGPKQYENNDGLMMLPADMALVQDAKYKKIVEEYAKDQDKYFKDFSKDFQKLLELGIQFPSATKVLYFDTLDEQGI